MNGWNKSPFRIHNGPNSKMNNQSLSPWVSSSSFPKPYLSSNFLLLKSAVATSNPSFVSVCQSFVPLSPPISAGSWIIVPGSREVREIMDAFSKFSSFVLRAQGWFFFSPCKSRKKEKFSLLFSSSIQAASIYNWSAGSTIKLTS